MKAMTQPFKALLLSLFLFLPVLIGCAQEGPAERAGEAVDEATENVGDKLEEAGDAAQDATD